MDGVTESFPRPSPWSPENAEGEAAGVVRCLGEAFTFIILISISRLFNAEVSSWMVF